MAIDAIGVTLVILGLILFLVEVIHPGAFLLIPGTILLAGGIIYILAPDLLLYTAYGPLIVMIAAVLSIVVSFPIYSRLAPNHPPLVTTPTSLVGRQGIVTVPVVPDSMSGKVLIESEVWSARSDRTIQAGGRVRVVGGQGVCVIVEPVERSQSA